MNLQVKWDAYTDTYTEEWRVSLFPTNRLRLLLSVLVTKLHCLISAIKVISSPHAKTKQENLMQGALETGKV